MSKCPICFVELKEWEIEGNKDHLIVTKTHKDSHIHVHGDLNHKEVMEELLENSYDEIGLIKNKAKLEQKEFVFHNRQRIGDILVFTCAVRDFKAAYPDTKVNIISTAMHIWDNNPNIDSSVIPTYKGNKITDEELKKITIADFFNGDTNVIKIGPSRLTNSSNRIDWHFTNAYRISIEDTLNIKIQQGESRPNIWLTEEEYNAPREFKDPYWLIVVSGEKGWGCKMYPFERWQAFVNQNPDINFVQLGTKGDNPPRLQGANVIDYVGKTEDRNTGIRDLYKLFLNAEGSIGLVSFHMHLSGALYKPSIVIAGAREPVSFTRYAGHQYLATDGCLPCAINACWHCDINSCPNLVPGTEKIPKCVDLISPEDLTKALNQYYIGGRLKKGVVSDKPKQFKNIVKSPVKTIVQKEEIKSNIVVKDQSPEVVEKLKPVIDVMSWGNASIWEEDWKFLQKIIKDYSVDSILEFGAGLSTIILNEAKLKVVTYENSPKWLEATKKLNRQADIRLWDGISFIDDCKDQKFDLAFVDGPRADGAKLFGRQHSIEVASKLADIVVVHDASRPGEMLWQDTYLKENYDFIGKGGKWEYTHLWIKKGYKKSISKEEKSIEVIEEPKVVDECQIKSNEPINTDKKYIKFVSTARGWGGCGRSIATIMKFLLKEGHKVEFIPFMNKIGSSELKVYIKDNLPNLIVTEHYRNVMEACDIFFIYGDDYIWEFGTPLVTEAFSGINANKKIMMLNYRRGKVGEIPWTQGWDKYMFLNSTQERELLKVLPGVKTKVLPPCTELEEFIKIQPNYKDNLRIVRVSSQGDVKFDKENFAQELEAVLQSRSDIQISMLPGPSFVQESDKFKKIHRTADMSKITEFLGTGNLFWYSLPKGYMDMGPRVIIEAMAAGLPIIADNWGGAIDRITPECGWLCDTKEQMLEIIKNVTPEELETKGKAAKARAIAEFIPERWIQEILE